MATADSDTGALSRGAGIETVGEYRPTARDGHAHTGQLASSIERLAYADRSGGSLRSVVRRLQRASHL